jgi:hypothetical protein
MGHDNYKFLGLKLPLSGPHPSVFSRGEGNYFINLTTLLKKISTHFFQL